MDIYKRTGTCRGRASQLRGALLREAPLRPYLHSPREGNEGEGAEGGLAGEPHGRGWAHGGPHGERGARWDPGELPSTGSGILAGERQGWDYLATRRHDTHGYVLYRGDERKRTPRREKAANPTKSTKVGGTTLTRHWGHGDTPRRRTGEIAWTTPREGSGATQGTSPVHGLPARMGRKEKGAVSRPIHATAGGRQRGHGGRGRMGIDPPGRSPQRPHVERLIRSVAGKSPMVRDCYGFLTGLLDLEPTAGVVTTGWIPKGGDLENRH